MLFRSLLLRKAPLEAPPSTTLKGDKLIQQRAGTVQLFFLDRVVRPTWRRPSTTGAGQSSTPLSRSPRKPCAASARSLGSTQSRSGSGGWFLRAISAGFPVASCGAVHRVCDVT